MTTCTTARRREVSAVPAAAAYWEPASVSRAMLALTCAVDLVLPPGSLSILCNSARYEMAHSVLPQEHASRQATRREGQRPLRRANQAPQPRPAADSRSWLAVERRDGSSAAAKVAAGCDPNTLFGEGLEDDDRLNALHRAMQLCNPQLVSAIAAAVKRKHVSLNWSKPSSRWGPVHVLDDGLIQEIQPGAYHTALAKLTAGFAAGRRAARRAVTRCRHAAASRSCRCAAAALRMLGTAVLFDT